MKLGLKFALIISFVNLIWFGGLTVASLMFSSNAITSLADENAANITSVMSGAVNELNTKNHTKIDFLLADVAKFKIEK